ncbi:MAG: cytochrome c biogenesis protein ResB [Nitrospirota bacterium]|nr:cytochrome c biogenesis protein ResB [Nitrospirota bacterium]
MKKEKGATFIDKIWDMFASVKFAVIIFAVIALTSIAGTIVEQQAEPEKNIVVLTKLFGESVAPDIYNILFRLGFMDMYHSWWFVALLLLFASSLIICSIDRLPRILKLVGEPIHPLPVQHLEKMTINRTLDISGKIPDIKQTAATALKEAGFKPSESSTDNGGLQLYAEKGNFSRLGVYLTHISILVILAGGMIGSFFGFNGYLQLNEGETSSVAYKDPTTPIPLGFEIRCDNFEVYFYGDSDMPKDYKSWLTVLKNGKEVMKKTIEVNDPLKYEGITFYQSSYGAGMDTDSGIFVLRVSSKDGKSAEINPMLNDKFTIPGTSITGHIKYFSPALAIDPEGRAYTYAQQMLNPAAYIEFTEAGAQKYSGWFFRRYPNTWILPDGNKVEFLNYWGVEYTGMQVRKDPGVFIVYSGCFIMALGLYITFFMSHRRIWVDIAGKNNKIRISIGASANKNRAAFEGKIDKLARILGAGPEGKK